MSTAGEGRPTRTAGEGCGCDEGFIAVAQQELLWLGDVQLVIPQFVFMSKDEDDDDNHVQMWPSAVSGNKTTTNGGVYWLGWLVS